MHDIYAIENLNEDDIFSPLESKCIQISVVTRNCNSSLIASQEIAERWFLESIYI